METNHPYGDLYADCFIEQWIRAGGQRKLCYPPDGGLPETSVEEAFVESSFMRNKG